MKLSLTKTLHFDYPWRIILCQAKLKKKRGCYKIITAKSCFVLEQKSKRFLSSWKKKKGLQLILSSDQKSWVFPIGFSLLNKNWKKKKKGFDFLSSVKRKAKSVELANFHSLLKTKTEKKKVLIPSLLSKEWSKVLSFHSLSKTKTREKKVLVLSCVKRTTKTAFCICWKQKLRKKKFCRILSPFKRMTMLKTKAGKKKKMFWFCLFCQKNDRKCWISFWLENKSWTKKSFLFFSKQNSCCSSSKKIIW